FRTGGFGRGSPSPAGRGRGARGAAGAGGATGAAGAAGGVVGGVVGVRGAWGGAPLAVALRGRRFVAPSLTPYPTRTGWRFGGASGDTMPGSSTRGTPSSSAASPLVAARAGGSDGGAAPPSAFTAMIGVPTSTVSPSATISSATTPSNGQGSSTMAFAVSISTMVWLTSTASPGWT